MTGAGTNGLAAPGTSGDRARLVTVPGAAPLPPALPPALAGPLEEARGWMHTRTERVPLDGLDGWAVDARTGCLRHRSGRFFAVEGLRVRRPDHAVPAWDQPIINQPETGILGLLLRRVDGEPQVLVQLKAEPGNCNGIQLSPTVQATRSNYQGVHGGSRVPYVEFFTADGRERHRVLCDVRQSEQGAWFLRKRNRNIAVEVDPAEPVPVRDGFVWLPLPQLLSLLAVDDLVNMDTRSVLACLPAELTTGARTGTTPPEPGSPPALHSTRSLLSWIVDVRESTEPQVERVPLAELASWRQDRWEIAHDSGRFFRVIGVRVEAAGREVAQWSQPMIAPVHTGLVAFLVTRVDGALHVLLHCRSEPGFVDTAELAPTVQCAPESYEVLPAELRPRHLDLVLAALAGDRSAVRFDAVLSEEGGRFHHARTRHVVVETGHLAEDAEHRWVSVHQIDALLRHSHYVNMQARSLLVCLRALEAGADRPGPAEASVRRVGAGAPWTPIGLTDTGVRGVSEVPA